MKLNSEYGIVETQTLDSIEIYKDGWELPMVWGVGASYWGQPRDRGVRF